jgi:hypothetical protein
VLFEWLRHSVGIDHIVAKAVDVLGSIRAECAQSLHVDRVAFLEQLLQSLGHRYQRVERQQIRYEVIVFRELTLLIAHVLGDHALAAETYPLRVLERSFWRLSSGSQASEPTLQLSQNGLSVADLI